MMTKEMELKQLGRTEGILEGMEKGIQQGIQIYINSLKDFSIPMNEIIKKVKENYGISEEDIDKYL